MRKRNRCLSDWKPRIEKRKGPYADTEWWVVDGTYINDIPIGLLCHSHKHAKFILQKMKNNVKRGKPKDIKEWHAAVWYARILNDEMKQKGDKAE